MCKDGEAGRAPRACFMAEKRTPREIQSGSRSSSSPASETILLVESTAGIIGRGGKGGGEGGGGEGGGGEGGGVGREMPPGTFFS